MLSFSFHLSTIRKPLYDENKTHKQHTESECSFCSAASNLNVLKTTRYAMHSEVHAVTICPVHPSVMLLHCQNE